MRMSRVAQGTGLKRQVGREVKPQGGWVVAWMGAYASRSGRDAHEQSGTGDRPEEASRQRGQTSGWVGAYASRGGRDAHE